MCIWGLWNCKIAINPELWWRTSFYFKAFELLTKSWVNNSFRGVVWSSRVANSFQLRSSKKRIFLSPKCLSKPDILLFLVGFPYWWTLWVRVSYFVMVWWLGKFFKCLASAKARPMYKDICNFLSRLGAITRYQMWLVHIFPLWLDICLPMESLASS